ncbi:hypothetical protein Tco_0425678 [Tanacetum coccineum]
MIKSSTLLFPPPPPDSQNSDGSIKRSRGGYFKVVPVDVVLILGVGIPQTISNPFMVKMMKEECSSRRATGTMLDTKTFKALKTAHDFNSSIPTELKELPSKISDINEAIRGFKQYVAELKNLKLELLAGLLALLGKVSFINVQLSKLKILDALLSLLNKVTEALDRFVQAIESASLKTNDNSVPLAGQASTHPAKGEKNTQHAIITYLFQRRSEKDATRANLNKETIIPTTTLETTIIPLITTKITLIIPTTIPFQSPFFSSPPKTTPQLEGEQGESFLMNEEEIIKQKEIEQSIKADVAKDEIKKGKEELIDLLGLEVVERMYKDKGKYDRYCNKMLNIRAQGKIINYDVLSREKGPITLKVYMDDELELDGPPSTLKYRLEWKTSTILKRSCTRLQQTLRSTKRYKTSVQFAYHQAGTVLYEPSLGPGTNDLARMFSTFLVAEVEKRNLNPNK